uniref:Uncharacterized protein n=1 Tax=Romanomermis culicivorax TaxID=13658 RepID=A0A915JSY7_ROMCU
MTHHNHHHTLVHNSWSQISLDGMKNLILNPKKLHANDGNVDNSPKNHNVNSPKHEDWRHKDLIKDERSKNILNFRLENHIILLPDRFDDKLDFVARQMISNFFAYIGREVECHICESSARIKEYRDEISRVSTAFTRRNKAILAKILSSEIETSPSSSLNRSIHITLLCQLLNYYLPIDLIFDVRSLWSKELFLKLPKFDFQNFTTLLFETSFNMDDSQNNMLLFNGMQVNRISEQDLEHALLPFVETLDFRRSSNTPNITANHVFSHQHISREISRIIEDRALEKNKIIHSHQPIYIRKPKRKFNINFAGFQIKIALIIGFSIGMIMMSIIYALTL